MSFQNPSCKLIRLECSGQVLPMPHFRLSAFENTPVSYVAYAKLAQDWNGLKVGTCGNEIQACTNTKINVLGVTITLANMALWASL